MSRSNVGSATLSPSVAWSVALSVACAIVASAPSRAHAQPSAADPFAVADTLIERGVDLRAAGQNAEALVLFEQAFAAAPSPRARAQIALAQQALGHWVAAARDLDDVLASVDDAWIERHREALERARAKVATRVAFVVVEANVHGAEMWVDGARVAVLPQVAPVRVVAGRVLLEVRAPGYVAVQRAIDVAATGVARETVSLVAEAPPPHSISREAERPSPMALPLAAAPPDRTNLRRAAWISVAASGVLAAGGGAALAVRAHYVARYNDDQTCLSTAQTRLEQCAGDHDAATAATTLAAVTFTGAAIAALGGGAVLLLTQPYRPQRADAAPSAGFACGFGPSGVACAGRF